MGGIGDWSPSMWCVVLGCVLLLSSAVPLTYLLRVHGKIRKMTQQEVADRVIKHDVGEAPDYVVAGGAGVRIEANASIDTLRKAAARGDWALFWSWPLFFFGFCLGSELLLIALGLASRDFTVAIIAGVALVPMALFGLFMAWAAIYTDIDRSDDQPSPASSHPAAPHSLERR